MHVQAAVISLGVHVADLPRQPSPFLGKGPPLFRQSAGGRTSKRGTSSDEFQPDGSFTKAVVLRGKMSAKVQSECKNRIRSGKQQNSNQNSSSIRNVQQQQQQQHEIYDESNE